MATDNEAHQFMITWSNVTYQVSESRFSSKHNIILDNMSGHVKSGELVGIMGSGGSGKSVFLECLIGRRSRGLSGNIRLSDYNSDSNGRKYRIYYSPQTDILYPTLTARESVLFSSQIRNKSCTKDDHVKACDQMMAELNLTVCANNLTHLCSGGQQKRISIAMDLIAEPDVLVLDEPTSGLDSAACVSLLKLLASVAHGSRSGSKVAVIITIHQPTAPALMCLDRVLVLASNCGKIMYAAEPSRAAAILSSVQVPCPVDENPANVLMDVASGCFGMKPVKQLIDMQQESNRIESKQMRTKGMVARRISDVIAGSGPDAPIFLLLCGRLFLILNRDPLTLIMRIMTSLLNVFVLAFVLEDAGTANSCMVTQWDITNGTSLLTYMIDIHMDSFNIRSNYILVFSMILVGFAMSIGPVVFSMMTSLVPIVKEIRNNWYSCLTFWIAHTIVEALVTMIVVVFLFILPIYYLSEQKKDFERLLNVTIIMLIVMMAGQAFFAAIAIALIDDQVNCATACVTTLFPMCAACNFSMRLRDLSKASNIILMINPIRWAFDATMVALYGDDVCGSSDQQEEQVSEIRDSLYSMTAELKLAGMNAWALVNRSIIYPDVVKDSDLLFTTETLSSLFIQPFRSRSGKLGSAVVVEYDLQDDDLWKAGCFILASFVCQRMFGLLIFHMRVRRRS